MYAIKKIVLFLAFWITAAPLLYAQYFDKMSVRQRDSVLEAKAVEAILEHAQEYYADAGKPVIKYEEVFREALNMKEFWGRGFYRVSFNTASVIIWADTGLPYLIHRKNTSSILIHKPPHPSSSSELEAGYIYYDASDTTTYTISFGFQRNELMKKNQKNEGDNQNICTYSIFSGIFYYSKKKGYTRDTLPISALDKINFLDDNFIDEHGKTLYPHDSFREVYIIERYSKDSIIRTEVRWVGLFSPDNQF